MNKKYPSLLFFLFLFSLCTGQYRIADIPSELLKNADAVIRFHKAHFSVQSSGQAVLKVQYAVSILNEKGDGHSVFTAFYDKFTKAKFLEGTVYDKEGNVQKKLWRSDVRDYTAFSGSLFDDNRMIAYEPLVSSYPYTVEYSYEIAYNGLLNYPRWRPVSGTGVSLENALYVMELPTDFPIRYQSLNLIDSVRISPSGKRLRYEWSLSSFPALESQSFSIPISHYLPLVFSAPIDFSIDKLSGSMRTWQDFGKWIYELNMGRDELPDETIRKVIEMTEGVEDLTARARILYEYMQSKTRYVSIQLGIGSWQPFDAKMVDQYGYGDCKALVNYTMALFKAAGIDSYYTLVQAGTNPGPFFEELPANQFNHVILCLPVDNDTIWLECTSQHIPFGYLSDFSDDRSVLIINESGGELARTPAFGEDDHQRNRHAQIEIDDTGNALVTMNSMYSGLYSDVCFEVYRYGPQDQRKWFIEYIGLPGTQVGNLLLKPDYLKLPRIVAEMDFSVKNYSSRTGRRMFIPLNQFSRWTSTPPSPPQVLRDVFLRNSLTQKDEFAFTLPEGYQLESIPEDLAIFSRFGRYSSRIEERNGQLIYNRELQIRNGRYADKPYEELSEFLKKVYAADRAQLILVKDPSSLN
jgi:hypothetical protein